MNYLKVYCNLIRKAENRTPPEGYTEKHHTFPKGLFGKNDRIVVLTAREHYIAHALLERICMKRYGLKDERTIKITYAFWAMNTADKYETRYKNSHIYSSLRERFISNRKGSKMSKEAREKMSKSKRGRKLSKKEVERVRILCIKHNPGGYERTEKHILRLKECKKVYVYEIIGPNGERFIIDNMNEFCYNNPQYGLDRSAMNRVGRGKQKTHKGWKVTIIKKL